MVVLKFFPWEVYIAAVEEVCNSLPHKEAAKLRAETSWTVRNDCPPQLNISWEDTRAIKELREVSSRVILTADKG